MNASIKEGGIARLFDKVKKVLTKLQGGGNQTWVPEAGTNLTTKSIDKNGVYRAVDDGDYGWSTVYVNVPTTDSVTGIDPETGKTVTYNTDPNTGDLVKQEVPASIAVITPPTNPYGIYVDGQSISKEGMVVKAYDSNGNEMQTVPNSQISFNPTNAIYDPESDMGGTAIATIGDNSIPYKPSEYLDVTIPGELVPYQGGWHDTTVRYHDFDYGFKILTVNGELTLFGPSTPMNLMKYRMNGLVWEDNAAWSNLHKIICNPASAGDYYNSVNGMGTDLNDYLPGKVPSYEGDLTYAQIAAILKTGEIEPVQGGSRQTVSVAWPRIGDGMVLETTFEILVAPSPSGGDDT